jgi:hypothetical protein
MITIHFFVNGVHVKESQWPAVPRVGERVAIRDPTRTPAKTFEVEEIVWDEDDENTSAHVHLLETPVSKNPAGFP